MVRGPLDVVADGKDWPSFDELVVFSFIIPSEINEVTS